MERNEGGKGKKETEKGRGETILFLAGQVN